MSGLLGCEVCRFPLEVRSPAASGCAGMPRLQVVSCMPIPHRPRNSTGIDGLAWLTTDDGSRTLCDERLNETFHSGCGAVAESLQVYLVNSGVAAQLVAGRPCAVLEVGFGTAMDFLLTAALARHYRTELFYVGLDTCLPSKNILSNLHAEVLCRTARDYCAKYLVNLEAALAQMEASLEEMLSAIASISQPPGGTVQIGEYVRLQLIVGDAREFEASQYDCCQRFGAVYFDPFSPESCPELWSESMFRNIDQALLPEATLTTYCVQSQVRQRLASLGYRLTKLPGPAGGKREVLLATKGKSHGIAQ